MTVERGVTVQGNLWELCGSDEFGVVSARDLYSAVSQVVIMVQAVRCIDFKQ